MKRLYYFARTVVMVMTALGIVSWYFPGVPRSVSGWFSAAQAQADHLSVNLPTLPSLVVPTATATPTTATTASSSPPPVEFHLLPSPTPTPSATTVCTQCSATGTAAAQPWSLDDCSSMIHDMNVDVQLDQQQSYQEPTQALVDYYYNASAHWVYIVALMLEGPCAGTPAGSAPTALISDASHCSVPEGWLMAGYQTHVTDAQQHPENAAWDTQWESIYSHIDTLWTTTAGCA